MSSPRNILSNRLLLLLILGWGAYGPILGDRLPHADDLGFHLLRLAQLADLWQHGVWFSRWLPDLAHGYGYPLFNYTAPLTYYIALPFNLVGLSVPTALQLAFALGIVLAGWTMQRFLSDWLPAVPALVGGVAFMYAPYFSYDVLFRGNFGESLALFWMPLALWGIGRTARGGGLHWAAVGGLAYAGVVLSHNISGLIFSPLLLLYGVVEWWAADRAPRAAGAVVATLAIGLTVAAFFWLPALSETDSIGIDRLIDRAFYDVRNNFQPWSELLAWPTVVYRDRINPSPPPALGLVSLVLGLSGWLQIRRATTAGRRHLILFTLVLAGYFYLLRPFSVPLWDALPLVDFLQFPWRLLAVASLCPPVLIGWSLHLWGSRDKKLAVAMALAVVAILIIAAQPWLYPAYGPKPVDITVVDIVPYEMATNTFGATATNEYLPSAVRELPDGPPDWRLRLPSGTLEQLDSTPLGLTAQITADGAQTVTVSQFAFPGWWAAVGGARVPIAPSDPHGLITFDVPAGRSTVTVGFGSTPLRRVATVMSLGGLLLALGLLWRGRTADAPAAPDRQPIAPRTAIALLALGLLGGGVLPLLQPARLTPDGTLRGASGDPVPFEGGLLLLAAELPARMAADRPANVALTWRAEQTPAAELWTTAALRDAAGVLWSAKKSETPPRFRRAIPTNAWPTDRYALDMQQIVPLAGTPPGRYDVVVTLFERDSLRPLPVHGTTRTELVVGAIEVLRPEAPVELAPRMAVDRPSADGLTLIGYESDRAAARPGDPLLLTLFWSATAESAVGALRLTLLAADGTVAHAVEQPLDWGWVQAGDRWRTQHALRVPAALDGGTYRWQVAVCAPQCGEAQALDALAIAVTERTFAPPAVVQPIEAAVGPPAVLYGVSAAWADGTLIVTPVWLATELTATSYRVFVHLIGPDGALVAQSDGEPAQWTRPTTGWLPGEYINDGHRMALAQRPGADYRLRIGLYEPALGIRPGEPVDIALDIP